MGPHCLRRFLRYISKVYGFRELVKGYTDHRCHPQIAPAQVFLVVFWLWIFQWRSLNQVERRMAEAAWPHLQLVPGRPGSVDTVAYGLKHAGLGPLRRGLQRIVQHAQRAKVWSPGTLGPWHVVTVDGTELWATRRRHCSECQERTVGSPEARVREYYHRVVVGQVLGTPPRMLLDVEPLMPGEGERDAARRLLTRVLDAHGRWIDLVVVDAEYAAGPWLNQLTPQVWVLVRLKDRRYAIVQDVEGLWAAQPPTATWVREDGKPVQAWEAWEIRSWEEVRVPLRVMRFREANPQGVVLDHIFATTCPREVSLQYLWRCAHARWQIENTGFHELKTCWHASHCYVHHPVAIEALLLIGLLAVNLLWAYVYRQLIAHGERATPLGVVEALAAGFHRLCAPLRRASPIWDTS